MESLLLTSEQLFVYETMTSSFSSGQMMAFAAQRQQGTHADFAELSFSVVCWVSNRRERCSCSRLLAFDVILNCAGVGVFARVSSYTKV